MGDYRKLVAWHRARLLAVTVSRTSEDFDARERFGLANQMRRAAVSIVFNIAEGANRGSDRELRRFLWIARGSLGELEAQITIASDLELITDTQASALAQAALATGRPIAGLLRRLTKLTRRIPATRDPRPATTVEQTTAPTPDSPPTST